RAEPQRLFELGPLAGTSLDATLASPEFARTALPLGMLDPPPDRRMWASLHRFPPRPLCGQIDVRRRRQQRSFVQNRDALEPGRKKDPARLIFPVRQPRDRLLQTLHESADAPQLAPCQSHHPRIFPLLRDPLLRDRQYLP